MKIPHVMHEWHVEELDKSLHWKVTDINFDSLNASQRNESCLTQNTYCERKCTAAPHPHPTTCINKDTYLSTLGLNSNQELNSQSNAPPVVERYHPTKYQYSSFCHREGYVRSSVFDYDVTSTLGQLLTFNFQVSNSSNPVDPNQLNYKYERYCATHDSSPQKFYLRDRTIVNFPVTYSLPKTLNKYSCHEYCFNKREKALRWKNILTGLNKRSRRLKRLCKPCSVQLKRLKYSNYKDPLQCSVLLKRIFTSGIPDYEITPVNTSSYESRLPNNNFTPVLMKPGMGYSVYEKYFSNAHTKIASNWGKEVIIDGQVVIDLCSDEESESELVLPSSSVNHSVGQLQNQKENINVLKHPNINYGNFQSLCPKKAPFIPHAFKTIQAYNPKLNAMYSSQITLKQTEHYLNGFRNPLNNGKMKPQNLKCEESNIAYKIQNFRNKNVKTKCYVALENIENMLNTSEKGVFVKGTKIFLSNPEYLKTHRKFYSLEPRVEQSNCLSKVNKCLQDEIKFGSDRFFSGGNGNVNLRLDITHNNDYNGSIQSTKASCNRLLPFTLGGVEQRENVDKVIFVSNSSECISKTDVMRNNCANEGNLRNAIETSQIQTFPRSVYRSVNESSALPLDRTFAVFPNANGLSRPRTLENGFHSMKKHLVVPKSKELLSNGRFTPFQRARMSPFKKIERNVTYTLFKCVACNYATTIYENSQKLIHNHIIFKHNGYDNVTVMKQITKGANCVLVKTFINDKIRKT